MRPGHKAAPSPDLCVCVSRRPTRALNDSCRPPAMPRITGLKMCVEGSISAHTSSRSGNSHRLSLARKSSLCGSTCPRRRPSALWVLPFDNHHGVSIFFRVRPQVFFLLFPFTRATHFDVLSLSHTHMKVHKTPLKDVSLLRPYHFRDWREGNGGVVALAKGGS